MEIASSSALHKFMRNFILKNGPTLASFSFIFSRFKQTTQFLQQIDAK